MTLKASLLLFGALLASPFLHGEGVHAVDIYTTAQGRPKAMLRSTAELVNRVALSEKRFFVFVNPERTFQEIEGIGGAITDSSAAVWSSLPEEARKRLLKDYFSPTEGIGYSLVRTTIHSCDFSPEPYTYCEDGDKSLKSFSLAHDQRDRLPMLRSAIVAAGGSLKVYASPWSPPGWMKDNGSLMNGGSLLPSHSRTWANYIVRFAKEYAKAGVPLWGLTVQNEPMNSQRWESCVFSDEQERDFIKRDLGPALHAAGLYDLKLLAWDHNRTLIYRRAQTIYDDPEAARYIWGLSFHWYVSDCYENIARVRESYPNKHLVFSEGCAQHFRTEGLDDWSHGERYASSMIRDFNNGTCAWTDWNLLLDERGGPNHADNYCFAPVHAMGQGGELRRMNSYYYIGHFSKFVRPGARRIAASASNDTLETTAFLNTDGSIAVIVLNRSEHDQPFALWLDSLATPLVSPAHSIQTLLVGARWGAQ